MLAALALHLWGLEFGVPSWIEDDPHVAQHVEYLRRDSDTTVVKNRDVQYPLVLPGLTLLLPTLKREAQQLHTTREHMRQASYAFHEVRRVVALFSILLIPLTYLLAKRFVPVPWALGAAALITFSLLEHNFAQQARPHGLAAVLFTLALWSYLRLARAPTWSSYAIAGLTSALAIGVLHSGFAVALPCAAAHLLRDEKARPFFTWKAWIPPLCALAALRLFYPFFFDGAEVAAVADAPSYGSFKFSWAERKVSFADHEIDLAAMNGYGFKIVLRTLESFEPALLGLLALALIVFVVQRMRRSERARERAGAAVAQRRELWVLLAFVLPYLAVIGVFERTYERFVLPLLPCFAIFAMWGLWQLSRSALPKWIVRAAVALALIGCGVQAAACARLSYLRSLPSTTDLAGEFLAAQPDIDKQVIYLWPTLDVPLARIAKDPTRARRIGGTPTTWSEYLGRLTPEQVPEPRYDVRFFVKRPAEGWTDTRIATELGLYLELTGPGWYVVNRSYNPSDTDVDRIPDELRKFGKVVFASAPEPHSVEPRFRLQYQDEMLDAVPNWTCRLFRAERVGPVLEIVRIP